MADETEIPRKPRRGKRAVPLILSFIIIPLVVGYFVATSAWFFKNVVLPRAGKSMNATITVGEVSIHPWSSVSLRQLKVVPKGHPPLFQAESIRLRYNLRSLIAGNLVVHEATVESPVITIVENADGSSNLKATTSDAEASSSKRKSGPSSREIQIQNISVRNGVFSQQRQTADSRQKMELTALNFSLDRLAKSQPGQAKFSGNLSIENEIPAHPLAKQGKLEATLQGNFNYQMDVAMNPQSLKADGRFETKKAEGNLGDLSGLLATLSCDLTPTEIKEGLLRFAQGANTLGEIKMAGPLNFQTKEAHLTLEVSPLDRRVLNLFGAANGWDFAKTRIVSSHRLDIAAGAKTVEAKGRLSGTDVSVIRNGTNSTPMDLELDYTASMNSESRLLADVNLSKLLFKPLRPSSASQPLTAKLHLDTRKVGEATELNGCRLQLTPTPRAKNELTLSGKIGSDRQLRTTGKLLLEAAALDLTAYYNAANPPEQQKAEATKDSPPAPPKTQEPEPMPLPMKDFLAEIKIGALYLREIAITNFQAQCLVDDNHVRLKNLGFILNGGKVHSTADVNLGVKGYTYELDFSSDRLPLEPIANTLHPDKRGAYQGTLISSVKVKGAGLTGPSLQKNLAATANFTFTNANIQVVGPKLKRILVPIAAVLRISEITESPLNWIDARTEIAAGKIQIKQFTVESEAFQSQTRGTIPMAQVLSQSKLNKLPVDFSLRRSHARKANLLPANTPEEARYVLLPTFIKLEGTLEKPKPDLDEMVLAGLLIKSGAGIGGLDKKTGGVLSGISGLLTGKNKGPSTNTASTNASEVKTNTSSIKTDKVKDTLKNLFKK